MVAVSYLVHYYTLLQNATDVVTKYDSYFITKYEGSLLQNASILLPNPTILMFYQAKHCRIKILEVGKQPSRLGFFIRMPKFQ